MAATATRMLTKFGQTVTFTRPASGAFDPVTGSVTGSATTYTGIGAKLDYKASEIDGVQVQMGDARLVCNAMDTAPLIDDSVALCGVSHRVVNVEALNPSATVVIYQLQVRL